MPTYVHILAIVLFPTTAAAAWGDNFKFNNQRLLNPHGVGLGAAIGGNYSPSEIFDGLKKTAAGGGFAWGFFVDIPIVKNFSIMPAAMMYEINFGGGYTPITDVDLNFKFRIPIHRFTLSAGPNIGVSNAEAHYRAHFGAVGMLSFSVMENFDIFAMMLYKRISRPGDDVDTIQEFAGGMFVF
jgi:hypothetical protein